MPAARSGSVFEDAPARLDDAVPTGAAFDAGLESLIGATSAEADEPDAAPVDERLKDLPPRRKPNGAGAPPAPAAPAPAAEAPPAPAPAAPGLPEALIFADPAPAAAAAAAPARMPEAPAEPAPGAARRRRSGPEARTGPRRPPAPATRAAQPPLLQEAPPPRLFGKGADAQAPAPPAPPAPAAAAPAPPAPPAPAAAAPPAPAPNGQHLDGAAPRLFGSAAPADVRRPRRRRPHPRPRPARPRPRPSRRPAWPKWVPRQAGYWVIPGADVERGAAASQAVARRVRSLLSSYNAGRARARTEGAVPAGPLDERDAHD